MKSSIYIETSILSYLTARPSRNIRAVGWQQVTSQWWDEHTHNYDLYTSELVVAEASSGDPEAAGRRLNALKGIPELPIDEEVEYAANKLIENNAKMKPVIRRICIELGYTCPEICTPLELIGEDATDV